MASCPKLTSPETPGTPDGFRLRPHAATDRDFPAPQGGEALAILRGTGPGDRAQVDESGNKLSVFGRA